MADPPNPYAPPTATVADVSDHAGTEPRLAERGTRLSASMIDGLVMLLLFAPAMWAGMVLGGLSGTAAATPPAILVWAEAHPVVAQIIWGIAGLLVFFAVNGYWLHTRGQSVGKRLLKIRIVRGNGERATLSRIVFARYLPTQAVGMVPVIGILYALIDLLFIFRDSRRCLHDTIADTIVVKD
ncbi:MAG: RDD family protein [Gammaproteobacteria bacterium]